MSYTIKPVTQYAVVNNANGLPIALCKDKSEAVAVANMMAGHGKEPGKPYSFADWTKL